MLLESSSSSKRFVLFFFVLIVQVYCKTIRDVVFKLLIRTDGNSLSDNGEALLSYVASTTLRAVTYMFHLRKSPLNKSCAFRKHQGNEDADRLNTKTKIKHTERVCGGGR